MKSLNVYITEAWAGVKKQTHNQDVITWCDEMDIKNYTINSKGHIDVDGNVNLSKRDFKELPYKFGVVDGDFDIESNKKLTSLKNCPDKVVGYFSCHNCVSLTSLEGAPEVVGRNFWCSKCTSLTSLEYAPKEVGVSFYCYDCTSLISLEGAPKKVRRFFSCSECTSLTSLVGAPKEVEGEFSCHGCKGKFTKDDVEKICKVKGNIIV